MENTEKKNAEKESTFKEKCRKVIGFLLNPRLLLCFGIAWLITNGWSYIMLGLGTYYGIGWMIAVASAYLAFLWLPVSPEKIVTFIIAIALLRWLFPNDTKTLAVLKRILQKTRDTFQSKRKEKVGEDSIRRLSQPIVYADLFWLFIAGSLLGVLMEGKSYFFQFVIFALAATVVEYFCGALLKYGLHMRAWDYSREFLNIDGLVCPAFTLGWGIVGITFSRWCAPALKLLFFKMRGIGWNIACICLSVFMAVNLLVTSVCIFRWSQRHQGIAPCNSIEQYIDETWDDSRMQKRFCEWRFIDEEQVITEK